MLPCICPVIERAVTKGRGFSPATTSLESGTLIQNENIGKSSLLAGGYWVFHRGKPVPYGNRAPSWIFEAHAPGYEQARAKIEGGGGREGKNRLLED